MNKQLQAVREFKPDLTLDTGMIVFQARVKRGLTQTELAKKMGSAQSTIGNIERGRELPSLKWLKRMADALDVTLVPPHFSHVPDPVVMKRYKDL